MSILLAKHKQAHEDYLVQREKEQYVKNQKCREFVTRMNHIVSSQMEVNETFPKAVNTDCPEFKKFVEDFNAREKLMKIEHWDYYADSIKTCVDTSKNLVTYQIFHHNAPKTTNSPRF